MSGNIEYLKGKGFDANPQNINRGGRPKKGISLIIQELEDRGYEKVTRTNISDIFELMIVLTELELKSIEADEKMPMIMRIVAKNILSDKGFETMERIMDRIHGKPTQRVYESVQSMNYTFTTNLDDTDRPIDSLNRLLESSNT